MAESKDQGDPESVERPQRFGEIARRAAELSRRRAIEQPASARDRRAAAETASRAAIERSRRADAARKAARRDYEVASERCQQAAKSLETARAALEEARKRARQPNDSVTMQATKQDLAAAVHAVMLARQSVDKSRAQLNEAFTALRVEDEHVRRARMERLEAEQALREARRESVGENRSPSREYDRQSWFLSSMLDEPIGRARMQLSLGHASSNRDALWHSRPLPGAEGVLSGFARDRLALWLDREELSRDFWVALLKLLANERPDLLVRAAGEAIQARNQGIEVDPEVYRMLGTLLYHLAERADQQDRIREENSKGDERDDRD